MSAKRSKRSTKLTSGEALSLRDVMINDRFWSPRVRQVREVIIPYQWEVLNDRIPAAEPSYAIENFRIAAGEKEGEFYGWVFQDSDVAKWLEAVGYCLTNRSDPELERLADSVIDVIVKAQQADGYLNTYFTIKEPAKRWTNLRDNHEMYCAGHMMEAAVAYCEATGKRNLLDSMCRLADHIDATFGPERGKRRGYPGHEEIELALIKLFRATGEERYLNLSKFFIDERGREPHYYDLEAKARGDEPPGGRHGKAYSQAHLPVREQTTAVGHAVRAMYLYSGMAAVAAETNDETLVTACKRLWDNLTKRQMYVTGGIGAAVQGEAFTFDYDLPNDTAYTETCAAIGLIFWAHRMLRLDVDRDYADVMERALYNGVLSGVSLDGKKYFYVNPLEVWPEACERRQDLKHVDTTRRSWFNCACCPPNIARLLASFGQYIYSKDEDTVYVHLFAGSEADCELAGQRVSLTQRTEYPWKETVEITVRTETEVRFTLAIRVPGWCKDAKVRVNDKDIKITAVSRKGYARIARLWRSGDRVEILLPMPIERIHAHPAVRANAGKVALQRGPVVYCLEEVDNGPNLPDLSLPQDAKLTLGDCDQSLGGAPIIHGVARRSKITSQWKDVLYNPIALEREEGAIKAIPYFAWANRQPGEMLVWIQEDL